MPYRSPLCCVIPLLTKVLVIFYLQVAYQNNVNDIIKLVIVNCEQIFLKDDPSGPTYETILLDAGYVNVLITK